VILFISGIKKNIDLLIFSIILIIFMIIYYQFSHNVYSNYMTYMFLVPLISLIINIFVKDNKLFNNLIRSSSFTIVLYMMLNGIFEIAGTSSTLTIILLIFGVVMYILSFISILKEAR